MSFFNVKIVDELGSKLNLNTSLNNTIMNIRAAFVSILAVSTSLVVSAQVENDDMYFNSKDRAKMQASRPMTLKSIAAEHEVATAINPTDSYSARNVNPEYISQSKVSSGTTEAAPYFIPDYTPTSVNQNLSSNKNSSYYSNYNNMAMGGYNPYGMYSPYGGGYNSFYPSMYGYGNPYGYNSLYNSGWSSMISLGFGMGMGGYYGGYNPYGGSSWAMGMGYGSPYYGGYGMSPYYGMGYGAGLGYYPHNVIIINDNNRKNNVVYGSRPSRSSDVNNMVTYNNRSSAVITDTQGRSRGSSASGRVSGDGTSSSSYYQRGWRSNPATNSALRSSGWSTSGRSSDAGGSNSGFGRSSSSGFESSGYNRSTNSSFGGGGGMRSSGGAVGGGSSSGGARRGRD